MQSIKNRISYYRYICFQEEKNSPFEEAIYLKYAFVPPKIAKPRYTFLLNVVTGMCLGETWWGICRDLPETDAPGLPHK